MEKTIITTVAILTLATSAMGAALTTSIRPMPRPANLFSDAGKNTVNLRYVNIGAYLSSGGIYAKPVNRGRDAMSSGSFAPDTSNPNNCTRSCN